jgi:predicted acyl esterase
MAPAVFVAAMLAVPSVAAAKAAVAGGEPAPFGHACKAQDGVRFCPTETLEQRVPSFDGVPLDADVTLPTSGSGPFPTIVMLHGWSGSKTSFESSSPAGDGNETFDYNNVYYAQHGYAVLNYSARGWGSSCGTVESRAAAGCAEGWIRLADQRYEARDTQYLLGLLADEKLVKPKAIGVTGISYGGGQSIELAYLKNRIRLPSGEFAPWTSPSGKKLEVKAAYPRWPWSDLVDALDPNGHFLDTEVAPPGQSYEPFGVEIESYESGLIAEGEAGGYVAPPGLDPEADLSKWYAVTNAGEPFNPEDEAIAHQIYSYHQGYGTPLAGKTAPMLLESGWTDDLFPVEQSLRAYNAAHADHSYAALMLGDLGHSPGANKQNTDHAFNEQGARFFAAKLEHSGSAPKNGSVTAYTETCPTEAPAAGPFTASKFSKLAPRTLTFGSGAAQTFTSLGGNPTLAAETDPIVNTDACKEYTAEEEADTANYTMTSSGFTLLGLPTIVATIKVTGLYPEIYGRLWDVTPGGEQRLVSRGVYRPSEGQEGKITFQLHGNGYEFPAGDKVKLQLLGRDEPYYRAGNGTFSIEASDVSVSLPTL